MAGSIWKGSISFGLLNIPASLQKAQEAESLSFSMLDQKDLSPIKYKKVNGKTGHEVPWERIVKGYQYEKGPYVIMNKEDLKAESILGVAENQDGRAFCVFKDGSLIEINSLSSYLTEKKIVTE